METNKIELNNTLKFAFRKDMLLSLLKKNLISTEEYNTIIKFFAEKFSIEAALI